MKLKNKLFLVIVLFILLILCYTSQIYAYSSTCDDIVIELDDSYIEFIKNTDYYKSGDYRPLIYIWKGSLKVFYFNSSDVINNKFYFNGYGANYPDCFNFQPSEDLYVFTEVYNSSTLEFVSSEYIDFTVGNGFLFNPNSFYIESDIYSDNTYSSLYYSSPIERGTEDNIIPDSGETGNETTGGDSENTTDSDDSAGILSSITQGFKNVIDFFTQLVEFVGNILSYLNPFSDNFILKGVIDFLGEILSYINPFSENFFVYKLIDLLGDLFEFLFIPNENSFTGIIDIVKSKFDFIDTIKISANSLKDLISNVGTAPKLTINVNNNKYGVEELTIIDLEWYKPYKTYGDLVLTGFIYAFFLWRLFITIPNIIEGTGGTVHDINDIYLYSEKKGGKHK